MCPNLFDQVFIFCVVTPSIFYFYYFFFAPAGQFLRLQTSDLKSSTKSPGQVLRVLSCCVQDPRAFLKLCMYNTSCFFFDENEHHPRSIKESSRKDSSRTPTAHMASFLWLFVGPFVGLLFCLSVCVFVQMFDCWKHTCGTCVSQVSKQAGSLIA